MDPSGDITAPDRIRELEEAFDRVIPEDLKTARAPTVLDESPVEGATGESAFGLYRPLPESEGYSAFFQNTGTGSARTGGGLQPGFATGLPPLDTTVGGLVPGSLTVITGPPGSGKTSLAKQLLDGCLEKNPGLLGFFFAPGERVADIRLRTLVRLASRHDSSAASTSDWRRGSGTKADTRTLSTLLQKAPWMAREYLIGPEAGGFDARGLARLIEREIRDKKANSAVLVVDHLLSLCATHPSTRPLEELSWQELMGLTLLAERIGGHVLVTYPFVRVPRRSSTGSEKREGPSEILSRLGPVAAEAPLVLSLTNGQAAGEGCLTVIKDRFGRTPRPIAVTHQSEFACFTPSNRKASGREESSRQSPTCPAQTGVRGPSPAVTLDLKKSPVTPPTSAENTPANSPRPTPSPPRPTPVSPLTTEPDRSPLRPRRPRQAETDRNRRPQR